MSKFLRVEVTRTSSTELYIEVPDDFKESDLLGKYQSEVGKLSSETTNDYDWDTSEWEDTVEVQSIKVVTEEEARLYSVGKLQQL